MLDLADLKARLEEQLAAVAAAEQALARVHALCGIPDASQGASADSVAARSATAPASPRRGPHRGDRGFGQ
jgi:hypothetical protein